MESLEQELLRVGFNGAVDNNERWGSGVVLKLVTAYRDLLDEARDMGYIDKRPRQVGEMLWQAENFATRLQEILEQARLEKYGRGGK